MGNTLGEPRSRSVDVPGERKVKADAPLNEAHPETFYGKGPVGYIDYPTL